MLGSLFKAIYIFGMECQTTLLDPGEPICRLPVEKYVVFVVVGYWACWSDTGPAGRILGNIGALQND